MSNEYPRKQDADKIYAQYVKPLEQAHKGQYVVVTSNGQTIFAPTLLDVAQQAAKIPSKDNFIFRVGEKVLGKLR
jgi:hypothetical protein